MKKKFFILCAALVWTVALMAQSIAVVKANGSTTLVRTLDEAIAVVNENDGCVVYLPGGGFSVSDDSKITKKVTIIGIGHKSKNDNVDGVTTISGNIYFNEGSDGSALMGCYLTGNVIIGDGGSTVNDILIRYCNINCVEVNNSTCKETTINHNFNDSKAIISNNVTGAIYKVNLGTITNNIIWGQDEFNYHYSNIWADNSIISYNVITNDNNAPWQRTRTNITGGGNTGIKNIVKVDFGEECINIGSTSWDDVFENNAGITPSSNFHFKEAYSQYESQVGLYANGVQFDKQIAPVPYIVAKRIDEQTDASGMLSVKIRVKAGGEEE